MDPIQDASRCLEISPIWNPMSSLNLALVSIILTAAHMQRPDGGSPDCADVQKLPAAAEPAGSNYGQNSF